MTDDKPMTQAQFKIEIQKLMDKAGYSADVCLSASVGFFELLCELYPKETAEAFNLPAPSKKEFCGWCGGAHHVNSCPTRRKLLGDE